MITKLINKPGNEMLRIGLGKHEGNWFFVLTYGQ